MAASNEYQNGETDATHFSHDGNCDGSVTDPPNIKVATMTTAKTK